MTRELTTRQLDVLALVAEGCTNQEIADRLHVGTATVQRHIEDARFRLDARNRVHVVCLAIRHGLMSPHAEVAP